MLVRYCSFHRRYSCCPRTAKQAVTDPRIASTGNHGDGKKVLRFCSLQVRDDVVVTESTSRWLLFLEASVVTSLFVRLPEELREGPPDSLAHRPPLPPQTTLLQPQPYMAMYHYHFYPDQGELCTQHGAKTSVPRRDFPLSRFP
ncbi:hypothetical protein BDU57DRAFT_331925 [Ampelomyces quisqualis]|uniref:Uncharacterized protein n=1 Tax=Ampelomyces quisqualis TaxID=50730 RepID=A0A6A5QFE3_AMPQU|nr:hypothetical protein BDU57DRAFT_331925 [Ampelomyces quisqualis]